MAPEATLRERTYNMRRHRRSTTFVRLPSATRTRSTVISTLSLVERAASLITRR